MGKNFRQWCLEENKEYLLNEWYMPINVISPESISYGTTKKYWWKCKENHLWEASVSNRRKGAGCPFCAGYFPLKGKTDFETLYPELAKEWDYDKNDSYPYEYTGRSNYKVWWKCKEGHSYEASIVNRTKVGAKGTSCPYCANQKVWKGFNDFATFHPELLEEWHYEKNAPLLPTDFTKTSGKVVWWKCKKGHEWKAAINNRVAGNRCFCCNPVATSYSEQYIFCCIKKLFQEAQNRFRVDEFEFDIYIDKLKLAIEYDGVFYHQNTEKSVKKEQRKNVFAKERQINLLRIKEVQEKLEPYIENNVIYFKYTADDKQLFDIVLFIIEYINQQYGYAFCLEWNESYHYEVLNHMEEYEVEKSLAIRNPALASEIHPTKNGSLKATTIFANSNKKIWWLCSKCGYEWESQVNNRNQGRGCPVCANKILWKGHNDFATVYPELLKDWDYDKNNISPSEIVSGYSKKIYWKCHSCGNEWFASPSARISKKTGCAKCAKSKQNKVVLQIDIKTEKVVKRYISIKEASEMSGYGRNIISECCNGKRESKDGYVWRFETV